MNRCFLVATVIIVAALSPGPTNAGRLELKNEISGVSSIRKTKLAVRCWSNEDDLGWDILKPKESRIWKFTTMNIWPFKKTEFRCQFLSGFGTTNQDVVRVFSVVGTFRKECGVEGNECIWVAKRDGFYLRKLVNDKDDHTVFVDVLKSKWVWKWYKTSLKPKRNYETTSIASVDHIPSLYKENGSVQHIHLLSNK